MSFFLGVIAGALAYVITQHNGMGVGTSLVICLGAVFIVRGIYDAAAK